MVNFLTKEFIREQRAGLINFILIILVIIIIAIAAFYTLSDYLEIKFLENKGQIVRQQNKKLEQKLSTIDKLKKENTALREEIKTKQEQLAQMVKPEEFWKELSLLAAPQIELKSFEFSGQRFSIDGVTKDMRHLNLLNKKLKEMSIFKKFYVSGIDKRSDFVFFTVEGQLQKGE